AAANCSLFFTSSRIFRSWCKSEGNSCGDAYQRERQSRFTFRRNPIGLTFCPISILLLLFLRTPRRFCRLLIRHGGCILCRFARRLLLGGFLFRFLLRLSCFPRLDSDFVRKYDADVTGALQNPTGAAASPRHDPLQRRSFADGRFFHHQTVRLEVRVVLRVGNCALQRFADQKRRFLGSERKQIERCRNRQTLDFTRDFAHLKWRNPRIFVYRFNFHYLKLASGCASTWRRSPTLILSFFESIS